MADVYRLDLICAFDWLIFCKAPSGNKPKAMNCWCMICTYSLSFFHSGGRVVHSYGRLIPHELPITNLQQISGTDGIGMIACTVSRGTAGFEVIGAQKTDVTLTSNGATATLVVNTTNATRFTNREVYCNGTYFYLFLSDDSKCTTQCKHYSRGRNVTYTPSVIYTVYTSPP